MNENENHSSGIIKKSDLIFAQYKTMYTVLESSLQLSAEQIIETMLDSGLRGRGGAGFPTAKKWQAAASVPADQRFVICNADEGEPGTFKDKAILRQVPRKVLTGMALCAKAIQATEGYIYLRAEYRNLADELQAHIDIFHEYCDRFKLDFRVKIFMGQGAYVCGEETALIESMEGKRGEPRNKPPFPTEVGYLGKPTVVNNVETFATAMIIFKVGASEYKKLGTPDSRGSKLFSVSGDTRKPGVHELELGMSLYDFVKEFGDGDTKAVQVGGAAGMCVPRREFKNTIIGFEGVPTGGSMILFNSKRSMYNVLHNYLDFFNQESCGQCTPCRVGCQQLLLGTEAVKKGEKDTVYLEQLIRLTETMRIGSKCGLGRSVGNAFNSIVENFKEEILY